MLPKELRRLCGKVDIPPDGGAQLINYLRETDATLAGVSNASVAIGNVHTPGFYLLVGLHILIIAS